MIKKFIILEWKAFTRAASFKANLFIKILMGFFALYFIAIFTALGVGVFYILKKMELEPFETVNGYLLYYLLTDLLIRFLLQKTPVMNIRPLLTINISKNDIVGFSLGKTVLSFFNWIHLFLMLPFTIVLILEGFDPLGAVTWFLGVFSLIFLNNFLNILSDNNRILLLSLATVLISIGGLQYFGIYNSSLYAGSWFSTLYSSPIAVIVPFALLLIVAGFTFRFFKTNLYLDAGLSVKQKDVHTENFTWLNQFGTLGTFLKNDIKLIKRNKRSRTTIFISVLFMFYGLLFFTGAVEAYDGPVWRIFAAIFVTGGFLFTFGQFVPSWDSSYYPLMMSQNIKYREYLNAKWWLMVIVTLISTVICSFYLYFGWEIYLAVLVGAIYNIGVNAHLVLWAGAYIKTPIDLSQNNNILGNKQAFNVKSLLLTIPKIILPLVLYAIGYYLFNANVGYIIVAVTGILGFAFKNKVFSIIENVYKTEKYKTLAAYKQTS